MIHFIEVFVLFIIGTVPFIVIAGNSKYEATRFPPLFCLYTDTTYMFYGTVLPTIIIGSVGLIMMLFALYQLHIVSVTSCYVAIAVYAFLAIIIEICKLTCQD